MGNVVDAISRRSEASNVVAMKAVVNAYESLKAQGGIAEPPLDTETYHRLEREMIVALGLGPRYSVLVVDDSQISCKLATRALCMPNFHTEVALSGEAGLDILKHRPQDFDLVILDFFMPGINGIEVLRQMKENPQLFRIPVAMLSGLEDTKLANECLGGGAVAVLVKPLKVDEVIRVARRFCGGMPVRRPWSGTGGGSG
ncbi:unnamed protein product, partial [Discosporangium mesarthrocarpum]